LSSIIYDTDAWQHYPHHRWVFNKLELSLKLGYAAGPGGVPVPSPGYYIVRPIYNLSGMSVGAKRVFIDADNFNLVKPGEFWCEAFDGAQITVDYAWTHKHPYRPSPVFAAQGYRTHTSLYRFNAWRRIPLPTISNPMWFDQFSDIPQFNVEYIGTKIIEIHLRAGIDFPDGATNIIPVWEDSAQEQHAYMSTRSNWTWHPDLDDADGHLDVPRMGFYYR
jgi:hypothetical protein